ncbi:MAG: MBL fold metallo-hydrolase [Pseudomonadota bacterium]
MMSTGAAGLATAAGAAAPLLGSSAPGFRRIKAGAFEITFISDGLVIAENPQSYFATDQDQSTVDAFLEQNLLPLDKLEFTYFPVVVNTGAELILIDTGNGPKPGRGQLMTGLAAAGYTPDQIDVVVITHMHPDHIGGMMLDGVPAFPNARYVVGQVEYDFFSDENLVGSPLEGLHTMTREMVTPFAEKTTFIQPGDSIVSGIDATDTFGHTPGHLGIHIESEGRRLQLISDAATHFAISLQKPSWESRFDFDKEAAAQTRRRLFDMLASEQVAFSGYHMPFPALGYVEATGDAYRYVPASYQFSV